MTPFGLVAKTAFEAATTPTHENSWAELLEQISSDGEKQKWLKKLISLIIQDTFPERNWRRQSGSF